MKDMSLQMGIYVLKCTMVINRLEVNMRIDKLLSDMGLATRSEARGACKAGQVIVDGKPVKDSSLHVDPTQQSIIFRGREIAYRKYTYVMLNKPEGYVSATEDSRMPVVTELLSD